ncbi:hypothetical protein BKP45_06515 [Anaerobacillus alkalidiazotrophicus]|uniref:DNA-binding response regulator n=1 Tax=Anaerobacillus alkalidiazotrophicus TaxID=472963 RepID=A0A1S2MC98_9BACI|nr:response regulator [Anaerobacillus alkalidiazotrophicus]OIJ22289.1 hypothetical protein BKP45_06515 [Anaerobacillus alkalidiazotrophicus]
MKAIIVDDEKHVREGLMLLADWENQGIKTIFEASDVEEAIEIISKHKPEIIFTDMNMPKRDGIDLLKWLHTSKLNCKTIVVSGYDDFHYMRNAIACGSFDYILKPIQEDILNETLAKAVHEWKEQNQDRLSNIENNKVINEVKPLFWDYLLSGILDKPNLSTRAIEQIEKVYQVNVSSSPLTIALIPMKMIIQKKYRDDVNLAFFSLLNICNEVLSERKMGIAFRNMNKEEELVLILWKNNGIKVALEQISTMIYQCTAVQSPIVIGQSSIKCNEAYDSSVHSLLNYNLLENGRGIKVVLEKKPITKSIIHLFDYSEEIKWAIQSGSTEQIDGILEKIHQMFVKDNYFSLEQIQIWENQFELLKDHWLKEYEIQRQKNLYQGFDYWDDFGFFSLSKFKEEKRKEFYDLIETVFNVQFKKEKSSVEMIEEYIRANYEKDIKLQDIADRFYLSREYISRKFKQEYHETITDYLTKIRIERAKGLLENPYLKIYDIAEAVGYQNDKYFIKVFKKLEGMTPNEYRSQIRCLTPKMDK